MESFINQKGSASSEMATKKLESAIKTFIGDQDPKSVDALLGIRHENVGGLDVLRFVVRSASFGELQQTQHFYNGMNHAEALDALYGVGSQVQASGIRCKVVIDFTAEPIFTEAAMNDVALKEKMGGMKDDGKAIYDLSYVLSAIKPHFVRP